MLNLKEHDMNDGNFATFERIGWNATYNLQQRNSNDPSVVDMPVDCSGEAEPHDSGCDCDECVDAAEKAHDEYIDLRVSDGE